MAARRRPGRALLAAARLPVRRPAPPRQRRRPRRGAHPLADAPRGGQAVPPPAHRPRGGRLRRGLLAQAGPRSEHARQRVREGFQRARRGRRPPLLRRRSPRQPDAARPGPGPPRTSSVDALRPEEGPGFQSGPPRLPLRRPDALAADGELGLPGRGSPAGLPAAPAEGRPASRRSCSSSPPTPSTPTSSTARNSWRWPAGPSRVGREVRPHRPLARPAAPQGAANPRSVRALFSR